MLKIIKNHPLGQYTTIKAGAMAAYFAVVKNKEDLRAALEFSKKNKQPITVLGGGSNILFSQRIAGLVLKNEIKGIKIIEKNSERVLIEGLSGESWSKFVAFTVDHKFYGLENLFLIYGTVGAAPVQNIGAYGVEFKDSFHHLLAFDLKTGQEKIFSAADCRFGYRDSIFKKDLGRHLIITEVAFSVSRSTKQNIEHSEILSELLTRGVGKDKATALDIREAVLAIRKRKLPDLSLFGTAGSFFKNPTIEKKQVDFLVEKYKTIPVFSTNDSDLKKLSAGWLIENAGCEKGLRNGGVGIYEKHALVLVNYGEGKSSEVFSLAKDIQKKVFDVFGVQLEFEVCLVGNF